MNEQQYRELISYLEEYNNATSTLIKLSHDELLRDNYIPEGEIPTPQQIINYKNRINDDIT